MRHQKCSQCSGHQGRKLFSGESNYNYWPGVPVQSADVIPDGDIFTAIKRRTIYPYYFQNGAWRPASGAALARSAEAGRSGHAMSAATGNTDATWMVAIPNTPDLPPRDEAFDGRNNGQPQCICCAKSISAKFATFAHGATMDASNDDAGNLIIKCDLDVTLKSVPIGTGDIAKQCRLSWDEWSNMQLHGHKSTKEWTNMLDTEPGREHKAAFIKWQRSYGCTPAPPDLVLPTDNIRLTIKAGGLTLEHHWLLIRVKWDTPHENACCDQIIARVDVVSILRDVAGKSKRVLMQTLSGASIAPLSC